MIAYFDASSFLKLVIDEPGSAEAHETWVAAHRRLSSRLLYPEARAGLARAQRMQRITEPELDAARARVEVYIEDTVLLDVTHAISRHAGNLAEEHGLRAYDAVHLASVDAIADEVTVLVAADGDLIRAARTFGISTSAL